MASSDHFSVVLESVNYYSDKTLGGFYGAAGAKGKVVTGSLEFVSKEGIYAVDYLPFLAGEHRLNVTFQAGRNIYDASASLRVKRNVFSGFSKRENSLRKRNLRFRRFHEDMPYYDQAQPTSNMNTFPTHYP